jgi:hypothetical protein
MRHTNLYQTLSFIDKKSMSTKVIKISDGKGLVRFFIDNDSICSGPNVSIVTKTGKIRTSMIPTGKEHNRLCISVCNVGDVMETYMGYCKKMEFDGETYSLGDINGDLHSLFKLNEKQQKWIGKFDISRFKLFNLPITTKFNGQSMQGPTIVKDDDGKVVFEIFVKNRCEPRILPDFLFDEIVRNIVEKLPLTDEDIEMFGIKPLPDFIYQEILKQLQLQKDKESNSQKDKESNLQNNKNTNPQKKCPNSHKRKGKGRK